MRPRLEYLTGESLDPDCIRTRYATSKDAGKAAQWLKAQFEENGAQCELHVFRPDYSPNVIWYISPFPTRHDKLISIKAGMQLLLQTQRVQCKSIFVAIL